MQTPILVFTYGTLKRGDYNNRILGNSKFLNTAKVRGTLYNLGPFPALSLHGDYDVHGEIFEVSEDTLKALDRLEGHPDFYQRQKVNTSAGEAWVYTMDNDERLREQQIIKDGNWQVAEPYKIGEEIDELEV